MACAAALLKNVSLQELYIGDNGVTVCLDCHNPETSDPENVDPPYYSGVWTSLTRVRNAGNTLFAANTNENWSVGDFVGLDNDGNNPEPITEQQDGSASVDSSPDKSFKCRAARGKLQPPPGLFLN